MFVFDYRKIKCVSNKFYHAERIKLERSRTLSLFFALSILIANLNSYLHQATRTLDRRLGKRTEYKVRVLVIFITICLIHIHCLLRYSRKKWRNVKYCANWMEETLRWRFFFTLHLSYVMLSTIIHFICIPFRIKTFYFVRRFSYVIW